LKGFGRPDDHVDTIAVAPALGNGNSFRARGHDCLGPIHVAIAPLEFGFQLYLEVRQIDQVPAGKFPVSVLPRFVFEAGDEMNGVIEHLVRRFLRLEINVRKLLSRLPSA
jgi:hypothetical protein